MKIKEDGMMPQEMQNDLTTQIKKDPSEVVNSAWQQAVDAIRPASAEDWSKVVAQTSQGLGLARQNNPSMPQASPTAQNLQQPTPPIGSSPMDSHAPTQNIIQPIPAVQTGIDRGRQPPQFPSYGNEAPKTSQNLSYNEDVPTEFGRVDDYSSVEEEPEYRGMTKYEQAQQIIKNLRKKKMSDNDILFSLVSRLFMDVETARKILDKEIKAKDAVPCDKTVQFPKKPMDGLSEDNIYNHMKVTTANNFPYSSYNFDMQRDPFEFELNSTQLVARAIIIDQRYEFEARFEVMKSNSARWPRTWDFLKRHNIHEVLKLSINQLQANPSYMRLTPDNTPIAPALEANVISTVGKAFKAYQKLWGKQHFQLVVISTSADSKVHFIQGLGKELAKISNLKNDLDLAVEFMSIPNTISNHQEFFIVLKNSSGNKIKESRVSVKSGWGDEEKLYITWQPFADIFHKVKSSFFELYPSNFNWKPKFKKLLTYGDIHASLTGNVEIVVFHKMKKILKLPYVPRSEELNFSRINDLYFDDAYIDILKEYYTFLKETYKDLQEKLRYDSDKKSAYSSLASIDFEESKESDAYQQQQDNIQLPGETINVTSDKPLFKKRKDVEYKSASPVEEDTESSAFMPSAPENVAGLVDLSSSKGHRKPIPFGGQTGNEINKDARNNLTKMGIKGYKESKLGINNLIQQIKDNFKFEYQGFLVKLISNNTPQDTTEHFGYRILKGNSIIQDGSKSRYPNYRELIKSVIPIIDSYTKDKE